MLEVTGIEELEKFHEKIKKLKQFLELLVPGLIVNDFANRDIFINAILNQIFSGIDSEGNELPSYSVGTGIITERESFSFDGKTKTKNQGEPFFLLDTGEFYDSVDLEQDGKIVVINADTIKIDEDGNTFDLLENGPILGLTQENADKLRDDLLIENIVIILEEEYFIF